MTFSNPSTLFLIVPKLQNGATATRCVWWSFSRLFLFPKNYFYEKNLSSPTLVQPIGVVNLRINELFICSNGSLLHR